MLEQRLRSCSILMMNKSLIMILSCVVNCLSLIILHGKSNKTWKCFPKIWPVLETRKKKRNQSRGPWSKRLDDSGKQSLGPLNQAIVTNRLEISQSLAPVYMHFTRAVAPSPPFRFQIHERELERAISFLPFLSSLKPSPSSSSPSPLSPSIHHSAEPATQSPEPDFRVPTPFS